MIKFQKILDWLEPRTDVPQEVGKFLNKQLPRNIGWLHTMGSLLMLYIVLQIVTGTLLAFYYNASPDHAYDSVRYIREELFMGRFVFSLHKQGAAFIFCVAVIHGLRGFLTGSYKNPRELLWMSGVAIFLLLTIILFTGMLLPYDQRAYWGTVVGLNMIADQPVVGDLAVDVLTDGTGELGIVSLSRFFILHVWVLPVALLGLIGLHIKILQRTNSAPPAEGTAEPSHSFFPKQLYKDLVVSTVGALALFAVAAWAPTHDTGPAPGEEGFVPYPEWYFLPHYQLLRVIPGSMQQLGTFYIPAAIFGLLFLLPFLDRSPERRISKRIGVVATGLVMFVVTLGFGAWGIYTVSTHEEPIPAEVEGQDPADRGKLVYEEYDCQSCHVLAGEGEAVGPNLTYCGRRFTEDWMYSFLKNPENDYPETEMPPFEGSEQELLDLVQYLMSLK